MGGACSICAVETACGIGASAVAITAKGYEIYKMRRRSNSVPIPKHILPPINRPRKIRNNTE